MNNLFDTDNYPDEVPSELVPGSRWAWTRSDITEAYPTDTYTLSFELTALEVPNTVITVTADKVDSAHVVEVDGATTDGYSVGQYSWNAIITRDSDSAKVTADLGFTHVIASVEWVYQVLEQIRASILSRSSKGEASYGIAGRSVSWRTYDELLSLEKEFSRRWERIKKKADRKAGRASSGRVLAKMSA